MRATVDDTGATTGSQDFTVFGEQLAGTGDFGFACEQADLTGQLHLRARLYNPTLGRFTTVDPAQPGAPGTTGYNLYTYSANNPTTFTDPSGRTVLAEYAALVGDQADATEVFASGVGNCANASFSRATAGLEGFDIGQDPGQAVLRDCRNGAIDAAATGAVFSVGGRVVGEGLEAGARAGREAFQTTRAVNLPPGTGPRAIDQGAAYEQAVRSLYPPTVSRDFVVPVDGVLDNGRADAVIASGGSRFAVEAKFVQDWARSLRNPNSFAGRLFGERQRASDIAQLERYSAGFEEVVYHTNSVDLAEWYAEVARERQIENLTIVITSTQ